MELFDTSILGNRKIKSPIKQQLVMQQLIMQKLIMQRSFTQQLFMHYKFFQNKSQVKDAFLANLVLLTKSPCSIFFRWYSNQGP